MENESTNLNMLTLIDEEFDKTMPIIHKESDYDYLVLLITRFGIRIKARVSSEGKARSIINRMIKEKQTEINNIVQ
jgi:hypothetical protein